MFETVVRGAGKDEIVDAELLEVAQTLDWRGVDAGKGGGGKLEVAVDWVVDHFYAGGGGELGGFEAVGCWWLVFGGDVLHFGLGAVRGCVPRLFVCRV